MSPAASTESRCSRNGQQRRKWRVRVRAPRSVSDSSSEGYGLSPSRIASAAGVDGTEVQRDLVVSHGARKERDDDEHRKHAQEHQDNRRNRDDDARRPTCPDRHTHRTSVAPPADRGGDSDRSQTRGDVPPIHRVIGTLDDIACDVWSERHVATTAERRVARRAAGGGQRPEQRRQARGRTSEPPPHTPASGWPTGGSGAARAPRSDAEGSPSERAGPRGNGATRSGSPRASPRRRT